MGRIQTYFKDSIAELRTLALWRDVAAEFFGTFFIVSIQQLLDANELGGSIYMAFGMGLVVVALVWSLGDFGGGHLNPAVTFAAGISLKIHIFRALVYLLGQLMGGIAGAAFVYGVNYNSRFANNSTITDLQVGVKDWQGLLIEMLVTCILVMTYLAAMNGRRKRLQLMHAVPIGLAMCVGILAAYPYTGGSMNPARSFGPAVILDKWSSDHWVYWVGPLLGSLLAVLIYTVFLDRVNRPYSTDITDMTDGTYRPHGAPSGDVEAPQGKRSRVKNAKNKVETTIP